jgi:hypothetical protein
MKMDAFRPKLAFKVSDSHRYEDITQKLISLFIPVKLDISVSELNFGCPSCLI